MEVILALVDFIPVILCFIAMLKLQKLLYHQMSKYSFAMFAAGSIMILVAGSCKAVWKLLYFGFDVDCINLNHMFFPTQALGFVISTIGLIIMLIDFNQKKDIKVASFVPVFLVLPMLAETTKDPITMVYVVLQVLGVIGIYGILAFISFKKHKPLIGILLIVGIVLMMGMGYLSTKTSNADGSVNVGMNWAAEIVNITAQSLLLISVSLLKKADISDLKPLFTK